MNIHSGKRIKKFIKIKIYMDRARIYVGYVQFIMIAYVFIDSLGTKNSLSLSPIGIIIVLLIMLLLGYLDTRLGIRKRELEDYSTTDPVLSEILENTRKILDNK